MSLLSTAASRLSVRLKRPFPVFSGDCIRRTVATSCVHQHAHARPSSLYTSKTGIPSSPLNSIYRIPHNFHWQQIRSKKTSSKSRKKRGSKARRSNKYRSNKKDTILQTQVEPEYEQMISEKTETKLIYGTIFITFAIAYIVVLIKAPRIREILGLDSSEDRRIEAAREAHRAKLEKERQQLQQQQSTTATDGS